MAALGCVVSLRKNIAASVVNALVVVATTSIVGDCTLKFVHISAAADVLIGRVLVVVVLAFVLAIVVGCCCCCCGCVSPPSVSLVSQVQS